MENIEIFKTQDGSIGLYDKKLNEVFHSKYGAKKEAFEKFIKPCFILNTNKPIKILDICYGIGYNTKCALENFKNIELIDCLEINPALALNSFKYEYENDINQIIEENIKKPNFINFYINDARKTIIKLNKKYDIIFHDGFAPHKQSVLWSEDFILKISTLMHENSLYCTYNHSKPILNALLKAGLTIGKTLENEKVIGTIASFNKELIKNKLNNTELEELNTKSAITYKDAKLNLSHEDIIKNRKTEIENSDLITLSKYKKQQKIML